MEDIMRTPIALAVACVVALAGCGGGSQDVTSPFESTSVESVSPAPTLPTTETAPAETPATTTPASTSTPTIPERYRGYWNNDLAHCPYSGDSRWLVEAHSITLHESSGSVLRVTERNGTLEVALAMTGEGTQWQSTARLRLSADGRQLTDLTTGRVGYRCP
jgi:hypothetical protein